jgi:hypothetical protein
MRGAAAIVAVSATSQRQYVVVNRHQRGSGEW